MNIIVRSIHQQELSTNINDLSSYLIKEVGGGIFTDAEKFLFWGQYKKDFEIDNLKILNFKYVESFLKHLDYNYEKDEYYKKIDNRNYNK